METGMVTDNAILSYATPKRCTWLRPLATRVAGAIILCSLLAMTLSQVIVRKPNFRQVPDSGPSRHEMLLMQRVGGEVEINAQTPADKPATPSDHDYKLHLNQ
jgi:hypothetical protein